LSCSVFRLLSASNYSLSALVLDWFGRNSTSAISFRVSTTLGNSTNMTTTLPNATVYINGTEINGSTAFADVLLVNITDNALPVALFFYNFSYAGLNLQAINITTGTIGTASFMEISGINEGGIVGGKNLTLYNASPSYTQVCVLDMPDALASSISSTCSAANETLLTCDVAVSNGKWCNMSGTTISIYNLTYSAAKQFAPPPPPSSSQGGGGSYSPTYLSSAFNCSSGELKITATSAGKPIQGLEIRLKDPSKIGWLEQKTTDSEGTAYFAIAESGRYSIETRQNSIYSQASLGPFQLNLCPSKPEEKQPEQNKTEMPPPPIPAKPQQNMTQNITQNKTVPQDEKKQPTIPEKIIDKTVSQLPISNQTKSKVAEAAAPTFSFTTICGAIAIVIAAIVAYVLVIKRRKGLEGLS
ncbi:MAG: hypothetical protein N3G22_05020, partial [Candidatus Micrarchaeota archaeon]|nr:hypothetical protein [Candidatus Micrarchaeota archaeon]